MKDAYGRKINYLRISLTNRCNLRCIYCRGKTLKRYTYRSFISLKEILTLINYLKRRGLKKVKITGGEPLLRKDTIDVIRLLSNRGLSISLTTNGVLLPNLAENLYKAGLKRINIGLDCLDAPLFKKVTGFDKYAQVIEGIKTAIDVGFRPLKINVVLIKGVNDDIKSWIKFVAKKDIVVRFIEVMPFVNGYKSVNSDEIKKKFEKFGKLRPVQIEGCGPAEHFKIEGFKGKIGFISPVSRNFCNKCNRLRLDALGQIRNCLFSSDKYDYLSLARNNFSQKKLGDLIDMVLANKPKDNENLIPKENMCQIGG